MQEFCKVPKNLPRTKHLPETRKTVTFWPILLLELKQRSFKNFASTSVNVTSLNINCTILNVYQADVECLPLKAHQVSDRGSVSVQREWPHLPVRKSIGTFAGKNDSTKASGSNIKM